MSELVGRDADLEVLRARLAGLGESAGELVVVMGEAGAGKTAMLSAFATEARPYAHIAWGDCFEGEGAPAFWPWTQVLAALEKASGGDQALHAAATALQSPASHAPERFAAFNRVAAVLTAQARPLVLVIDDLHWADGGSLSLLEFIAPAVRRAPILLVVGVRPGATAEVEATLGSLVRRGARRLDLRPFDIGGVAHVLRDSGASDAQAVHVLAATGGNPMFVTEMARYLASGGAPDAIPATLAATVAVESAIDIITKLFRAAGVGAVFSGSPIERTLRDVFTLGAHRMVQRENYMLHSAWMFDAGRHE